MILRLISVLSKHLQLVWLLRASDYRHSFSSLFPIPCSTTSTFLLILALGTFSLMVLGIFVRPIPLPQPSAPRSLEDGDDVQEALLPIQHHNQSCTALLSDNSMEYRPVCYTPIDINTDEQPSNSVGGVMEVTRLIQASTQNTSMSNVHGKAPLHNLDF